MATMCYLYPRFMVVETRRRFLAIHHSIVQLNICGLMATPSISANSMVDQRALPIVYNEDVKEDPQQAKSSHGRRFLLSLLFPSCGRVLSAPLYDDVEISETNCDTTITIQFCVCRGHAVFDPISGCHLPGLAKKAPNSLREGAETSGLCPENCNTSERYEEILASAHRNGGESYKLTTVSRLLWDGVEAPLFCSSPLMPPRYLAFTSLKE